MMREELRSVYQTGKLVRKLPVGSGRGYVYSICHDGARLLAERGPEKLLFRDATQQTAPLQDLGRMRKHSYVTVTPDSNSFALGLSGTGPQRLRDLRVGQLVRPLREIGRYYGSQGAVSPCAR